MNGKKNCGGEGKKRGCGKSREIGGQSVVRTEEKVKVKKLEKKSVAGRVTKIVRAEVTKTRPVPRVQAG